MRKFWIAENKDSAKVYVQTLVDAGYERVERLPEADFFLFDSEGVQWRRDMKELALKLMPGFIYPHSPLTCYLWDGPYDPLPVACNFVYGAGAKECMALYGYSSRVEVVGFPRCDILPFTPTPGRRLLFVPARPRRDKGKQEALDRAAWNFILSNQAEFDEILVCRIEGQLDEFEDGKNGNIRFVTTDPHATNKPTQDMIARIDSVDLVISVTTPAALAVARGKPTVMYGQGEILETLTGRPAKNYASYKHVYDYPLTLEKMTLEQVKGVCEKSNDDVEKWRKNFIGDPFDKELFLSVIREYV